MTFFNYFYVEIWAVFLISYTVKTNCYNDTKSETNGQIIHYKRFSVCIAS